MGGPKALVEWNGKSFLEHAYDVLTTAEFSPVRIVVGAQVESIKHRHPRLRDDMITNSEWKRGMGRSLHVGLTSLPSKADWAAVILVDQPLLSPKAVVRLRDTAASCQNVPRRPIVTASYEGRRGHPVLFHRSIRPDLISSLSPDAGARTFLRSHPELVQEVDCTGLGDPTDVDTPDELRQLRTN